MGERRERDAYYTPDALAVALVATLGLRRSDCVWEPHVGGGSFARAIRATGAALVVSDIHAPSVTDAIDLQPAHWQTGDFLDLDWRPDWIIGNPPFCDAVAHIRHALALAPHVAFLLRLSILESQRRAGLWRDHPPAEVHVLSQRPSFVGGATDSTGYCWVIWRAGHSGPPALHWLSWRTR